jgi:hypothetical protein
MRYLLISIGLRAIYSAFGGSEHSTSQRSCSECASIRNGHGGHRCA